MAKIKYYAIKKGHKTGIFTMTCGKPTPLGVGWIAQIKLYKNIDYIHK